MTNLITRQDVPGAQGKVNRHNRISARLKEQHQLPISRLFSDLGASGFSKTIKRVIVARWCFIPLVIQTKHRTYLFFNHQFHLSFTDHCFSEYC